MSIAAPLYWLLLLFFLQYINIVQPESEDDNNEVTDETTIATTKKAANTKTTAPTIVYYNKLQSKSLDKKQAIPQNDINDKENKKETMKTQSKLEVNNDKKDSAIKRLTEKKIVTLKTKSDDIESEDDDESSDTKTIVLVAEYITQPANPASKKRATTVNPDDQENSPDKSGNDVEDEADQKNADDVTKVSEDKGNNDDGEDDNGDDEKVTSPATTENPAPRKGKPPIQGITVSMQNVTSDSKKQAESVNKIHSCQRMNFDNGSLCCPDWPEISLVVPKVTECRNGSSAENTTKYMQQFVINQILNPDVPIVQQIVLKLKTPMIFIQCIFRKQKLFNAEMKIDPKQVVALFFRSIPKAWQKIFTSAVFSCVRIAADTCPVNQLKSAISSLCIIAQPMLLMQCVRRTMLLVCPDWNNNPSTGYCESIKTVLSLCNIFNSTTSQIPSSNTNPLSNIGRSTSSFNPTKNKEITMVPSNIATKKSPVEITTPTPATIKKTEYKYPPPTNTMGCNVSCPAYPCLVDNRLFTTNGSRLVPPSLGSFRGTCNKKLFFASRKANYSQALDLCCKMKMKLLSLQTKEKQLCFAKTSQVTSEVWTSGARGCGSSASWTWCATNEAFTSDVRWISTAPSMTSQYSRCSTSGPAGISESSCDSKMFFVCEEIVEQQILKSVIKLAASVTTTGKLQATTGKMQTATGKLQTAIGKLQTTGKFQATTGKMQTATGKLQRTTAAIKG